MSYAESLLPAPANKFLEERILPPFPVIARIEPEIRREGQPAVGRQTGSLLRALALARGATRILEVGTNLGYSGLWLCAGLAPGGRFEGIEIDEKLADRAQRNLRDAIGDRASVHRGAALDVLPKLPSRAYDIIFIDAVKWEYPQYLDHALRLARPGGVIAADNIFRGGQAWDAKQEDEYAKGLREFTRRIFSEPRLVTTVVGVEDGLSVSVVAS